jgi:hypothetical protein
MRTAVAVLLLTIPGLGTSGPRVAEGRVTGKRPAEKRAPRFAKLDVGLNRALATERPLAEVEHLGFRTHGSRVQVVVVTEVHRAPEVEHWLASRGATFVVSVGNLVQAFVDVALVPALDAHEDVLYVRRPLYIPRPPPGRGEAGTKSLAATTEGLAAMNADAWHAAGVRGQGVRVAVIDRGFQGYDALLGSDLPEAARVSTSAVGGAVFDSTTHGTACAEVVFDVVPDLERMTLLAVATDVDIASAISEAQGDGVDVVSMSLGWLPWGPNDGTGLIADAIDAFVAAGGMVVVSAGDERLTHWQGTWNDPGGDDFLDFAHGGEENYLTVAGGPDLWSVPAGTEISVAMVWNQWVAPETDLDLYLYRWSGTGDPYAVDMSEDYQTGVLGELPIEQLTYTVPTDLGGYFGVGVTYWSGPLDVEIEIIVRPDLNPLQDNVQEGSVIVPADTATAIAVAALDVDAPDELESYSSMGPTNGPGGSLSGGAVKPDISGFANVSTATYGAGAFPGTAAACPHVAGAAVLVWSAHPEWSNTQVRDYLESNAVDLGLPGKDNDHGHGRLQLGDPPVPSCDPPATPTGLAATDETPASGATYEISWSAVADAASYQLQEATDTAFSDASTVTVTGTSQSFGHAVSSATTYYYRVLARSDCGSLSDWSSTVSVTVQAGTTCEVPEAPSNLQSSTTSPASSESYVVSWDAVSAADSYQIQEATDPTFTGAATMTVTGTSQSYIHAVSSDTAYYYRVRASRDCGSDSDWSGTVSVTVAAGTACDAPATPSNLRSSAPSVAPSESYELSWDAVSDADSYQLQEATDTAFSDASTVTVAGTSKAFSHDVSNDTDYYYRVRARRDCGSESPWTAAVKVTVTTGSACASPDTPPNLESSLSAPYPDEPYTLSWDVVDDADMYELREADNPDFHESYAYYTYSPSKKVSHSVDEPTPYYYKVRARRECGSRSDWSEVVEVVVAPAGSEETWFYLVPGMARAPGANDTRWRSSLAVFNPGERSADLDITFRTDSGTFVSYTVVPPGATREWLDVVVELFGEGSSLAGAVAVVSSRRVIVTARTYNLSDVGTFGQYLPGCRVEDALSSDGVGYLPQIKGGDDFRTNIGFINFGGVACTVVVTLHDEVGEQIGSSLTVVVEPGAWMQTNDVFTTADAGSCQVGHAMVEVLTADCSVWGYASVVDQATGDPTTIPLFVE